jgi:uncharacterized protein (TIGR04255 family)
LEAALPFKTLSNAPIKEALIGIRVESSGSSLSALESAFSSLPADYQTKRDPITLMQTQLMFGPDAKAPNLDQKQLGWRFGTTSGKFAVQARTDWLIFSHLPKYTVWPTFSAEAERVWVALSSVYRPADVKAVTVRYINEVPLNHGESVEKYLKFFINVPEGVPQLFNNYFARIELQQSPDTVAVLQSGLLSIQPSAIQLLLDIELVKTVNPTDAKTLWAAINSLREPKNQIFFSCITEEWEAKLK